MPPRPTRPGKKIALSRKNQLRALMSLRLFQGHILESTDGFPFTLNVIASGSFVALGHQIRHASLKLMGSHRGPLVVFTDPVVAEQQFLACDIAAALWSDTLVHKLHDV